MNFVLIGLVSDTHIPEAAKSLPIELIKAFQGVDLIFHAGDIYDLSVLDELEKVAPVLAAAGDDDFGATLKDTRVKDKHTLKMDAFTIWLVHQKPYEILTPWWQDQHRNRRDSDGDDPDIVIFGHEHRTVLEEVYNILFINPGSPTFLNYTRGLGTAGILELKDGKREAHIIDLNNMPRLTSK
jgi:putative phosphoesterase